MFRNLLRNHTFGSYNPIGGFPGNKAAFCTDWFVEFEKGCEFHIGPASAEDEANGVRIETTTAGRWFRIWQPITFKNLEAFRTVSLEIRGRKAEAENTSLELEWVALLRIGIGEKRVFAKKLTTSPKVFGPEWECLIASASLDNLSSETPYIFALQFSGAPGSVELNSISLCHDVLRQDAQRIAAQEPPVVSSAEAAFAAPAQTSRGADGGLARLEGVQAIGWGELPSKTEKVAATIAERAIGSAPLGLPASEARGDEKLQRHGFALEVPADLLDGSIRAVSLRHETTGRRISNSATRLEFRHPVAPPPVDATAASPGPTPPATKKSVAGVAARSGTKRRRVAVVSWDMAHNPVGRAFLLADMARRNCDVELVGPMFPMYGSKIWPPIADSSIPMQAFPAASLRDLVAGAREIASRIKCDVVHVGKARFSSLLIGALIKQANDCPMVVDIDDHELSFFPDHSAATLDELNAAVKADPALRDKPFVEIWTRFAETLALAADGVTVSNYALQSRYGGLVVRHGRDESVFDPSRYDRDAVRKEFGYSASDKVILFLGTPRPHKGVFEIADALERIGDDRLALCVIGSINDKRVSSRFSAYKRARISLNPDQPWSRLAELVNMADTVFLLQDPASAISAYQIPAKLTDALAMGVPVYATPVPPLADLIASGAVQAVPDEAELEQQLRRLGDGTAGTPAQAARSRDYYLTELSYGVNAARIETAFDRAASATSFDARLFDETFAFLEAETGLELPRFQKAFKAPAIWKSAPPDLVFLWKQNDSDIYGRRPDMIAKYLLQTKAVGRIIHFDAPISAEDLDRQAKYGQDAVAHQGNQIYLNTVRRVLRQADSKALLRRTFLFRSGRTPERYLGADLPPRSAYGDFVRASLKEAGISKAPILWVCPVVFDYPEIRSIVNPACVVADIIDDQRRWPAREVYKQRIVKSYEEVLADADLVLANCEPVQQGFQHQRPDIMLVPNGAEVFDLQETWSVPEEIADLPRPILGYVGNLRDRVDLELIGKVADQNPSASVVLIGSAHDRPEVLELARRANVHILGVRPYHQAIRFIRAFDVAMVPHLRNELSDNMNPLKLYVYFGLNVPVVTTDIANISDIGPFTTIASNHDQFLQGIADVLAGRTRQADASQRQEVLGRVSWEARVRQVLSHLGMN